MPASPVVIPVQDDNPAGSRPYVTVTLIAACIAVFLWQFSADGNGFERSVFALGVIPAVLFGQALLPPDLPRPFSTADLAASLGEPRWLAQKMVYCLREMGQITQVGKRGNAHLYARAA